MGVIPPDAPCYGAGKLVDFLESITNRPLVKSWSVGGTRGQEMNNGEQRWAEFEIQTRLPSSEYMRFYTT
jgi:hypothetical protein